MSLLFETAPDGIHTYFDWLLQGLGWTLSLGFSAWVLALTIGTLAGAARTLKTGFWAKTAQFYVEIFRNVPLLVQMFLWFFVMPELVPEALGRAIKSMPPPWASFFPALLCLSLYTGARLAEQVRAGIEALARGQSQASAALGFETGGTYRYILLPQAFRIIIPTLTNEFMTIFKNTSVALTIGLIELTATAQAISENTFRTFEAFGVVTLIYLTIALIAWRTMRGIERALRLPGGSGDEARA